MLYKTKHTGFFLLLLVMVACSKVPRKYIQPNDMKKIMWEMMLADKKINSVAGSSHYIDSLSVEYNTVLAYYNVSQKKFVTSLAYYQSNPDLQKALYDSINNYGTRLQSTLQERMRKSETLKSNTPDTLSKTLNDTLKKDTFSIQKDSAAKTDTAHISTFLKNRLRKLPKLVAEKP